MEDALKRWLFDPMVGKLAGALVAIVIISVIVRLLRRFITRSISNAGTRYRIRKFITVLGYLIGIGTLAMIFSDRLGGLTVALGVARCRNCIRTSGGDCKRGGLVDHRLRRFL